MEAAYDDAVGAGHGRAAALGAGPDADDTDRAAGQTEQDVQVIQVNTNSLKDGGSGRRVGL